VLLCKNCGCFPYPEPFFKIRTAKVGIIAEEITGTGFKDGRMGNRMYGFKDGQDE
jgi:hypothetical protein